MKDNICTHCGAPLKGNKCEYCDTVYYDMPDNSSRIRELEREIKELEFKLKQRKIIDDMIKNFNFSPDPRGGEGGVGYTFIGKNGKSYHY